MMSQGSTSSYPMSQGSTSSYPMSQGSTSTDLMSQGSTSAEAMLNLFNNMPSDVIIDILSRLPVRQILRCKLVSRSWLQIIETGEFVQAQLRKSTQGLIVFQSANGENFYSFLELNDGESHVQPHDFHYNLISNFELPFSGWLAGSVDGLLFMCEPTPVDYKPDDLYICNPITREYVLLDSPEEFAGDQLVTYGFGLSKGSSQYKVVRIANQRRYIEGTLKWEVTSEAECHVYTLGTGSWAGRASSGWLEYIDHIYGVFWNGRIHWVVKDRNQCIKISCFDLETESFTTMAIPDFVDDARPAKLGGLTLFVSGGCLGLCDNSAADVVVVWLMKEYGVEESWKITLIMLKNVEGFGIGGSSSAVFHLVKMFSDGDVLLAWKDFYLLYFSGTTMTVQEVEMFVVPPDNMLDAILHTPSFLSLEGFGFENVTSF